MTIRFTRGHLASRVATGAFILHSGIEKWKANDETAAGLHGFAATAYPFLGKLDAHRFVRLVAAGEIITGVALLAPAVPDRLAGVALTGFSGALVGLYAWTPGLRREGSVWPTDAGLPIAKDIWLLGAGLDLLVDRAR